MSRMGKKPVSLLGASASVEGQHISIKGPLGSANMAVHPLLSVEQRDGSVVLKMNEDTRRSRAYLGTQRTLLNNMVLGVTKGFELEIIITGVGYRVVMEGKRLQAVVGKSHAEFLDIPDDIKVNIVKPTEFVVSGNDKQKVGQFASIFRRFRPVEPYKGKGIRFKNQKVVRKEGKKK